MKMPGEQKRNRILAAIALFKFVKSALLIAGALSAWKLLDDRTAALVKRWITQLPAGAEHHLGQRALALFTRTSDGDLRVIGFVFLGYAALFATEGVGLWLQRRWAEFLTLIATASFLPFEIYEVVKNASMMRVSVFLANVAVIVYLVWKLRQKNNS